MCNLSTGQPTVQEEKPLFNSKTKLEIKELIFWNTKTKLKLKKRINK